MRGRRDRTAAYFDAYGGRPTRDERLALMRLLLLHRYSNVCGQIAVENWREARDFAELAERLFV